MYGGGGAHRVLAAQVCIDGVVPGVGHSQNQHVLHGQHRGRVGVVLVTVGRKARSKAGLFFPRSKERKDRSAESFIPSLFTTLIKLSGKRMCESKHQRWNTDLYRSMRRNRMSLLSASSVPFLASMMSIGDPHMMNTEEEAHVFVRTGPDNTA